MDSIAYLIISAPQTAASRTRGLYVRLEFDRRETCSLPRSNPDSQILNR